MTDSAAEQPTVLVVDDHQRLTDLYAANLRDDYDVRVAYHGEAALEKLDGVDVLLVDRRMPGLSGEEVIRQVHERAPQVRVAVVTAVDPGFEVIDMPFDDYLVKPVGEAELRTTIDRLLALAEYDETRRELNSKRFRARILAAEKDEDELQDSEEYQRLTDELDLLRDELDEISGELELDEDEIERRLRF